MEEGERGRRDVPRGGWVVAAPYTYPGYGVCVSVSVWWVVSEGVCGCGGCGCVSATGVGKAWVKVELS